MKLRIIAGKHGGRLIDAPPTKRTHPMSERARNALFNSLADQVQGASVLDAFAGSGALGIEALSRGADQTVFIEKDRVASRVIKESLQYLQLEDQASVIHASVTSWLGNNRDVTFDLVMADPPYHDLQHETIRRLATAVADGGMLVLSWPDGQKPPTLEGLALLRQRSYAGAQLVFYQREA